MDSTQINRIEIAIDKLTSISSNLDKLLSVHEQRINAQEKQLNILDANLEKRRELHDKNMEDVYNKMRNEDRLILEEVNNLKKELNTSMDKISLKVSKLGSTLYYLTGCLGAVTFILTYGQSFIHTIASLAK